MITPQLDYLRRSIRSHTQFGFSLMVAVVFGLGGWAAATEIAGAVIAAGQVVVESNVKKIQHLTGGIVGQLRVRDGEAVMAGDLLIQLDDTVTRANLAVISKGLDGLLARKARLVAERDGKDEFDAPAALAARALDPDVIRVLAGEAKLFELRRTARQGQTAQLRQRIAQLQNEVEGASIQAEAKVMEIALIERELEGARRLWMKNLMPISKLTAMQREATRVGGEHGALQAKIAQAKGRIAETELQVYQVDHELGSQVAKELAEVDVKVGELVERKAAAEDQLKNIDIRAPQSGRVHQLAVHTVGGVVAAGEALMLIVPEADKLSVEARVPPHEIDQLRQGQMVRLRFTAFRQQTTEEIAGTLDRVSADVSIDARTGMSFYTVRIAIPEAEVARLGSLKLVPGMPVEAFVETAQRRVLSYLVKPLSDQLARAFRER